MKQKIQSVASWMRSLIWALALLLPYPVALADDQTELQGLYAAMNVLNQEQQALFQQFQMLQELRRVNDRTIFAAQLRPPQYTTDIPSYSDTIQAQRDAARRGEELAQQSEQLYAQYGELGGRKAQLQQRILELTLTR